MLIVAVVFEFVPGGFDRIKDAGSRIIVRRLCYPASLIDLISVFGGQIFTIE